jgi:quinol monooxygenase YgiN
MIIRIVKMTFDPERTDEFLEVFNASKDKIAAQTGCTHLELLRDIHSPNIFFTYSYWEGEEFLEAYRKSELFGKVWSATKALFSDRPQAWSIVQSDLVKNSHTK